MNDTLKVIGGVVAGAALTFGAGAISTDQQLTNAQVDKQAILKQYVDAEIRLNEVPTLDLSVASPDEYATAYGQLATEKGTLDPQEPDLFTALHDKAIADGVACK